MRRDSLIVGAAVALLVGAVISAAVVVAGLGGPVPVTSHVEVLPAPTTAARPASTSTTSNPPVSSTTTTPVRLIPPAPAPRPLEGRFWSTAYCHGPDTRMANGRAPHVGAVAGNRWRLGTVLHVWPNPWGDRSMRFTVEDRHAPGATDLDFSMPGECDRADIWGDTHQVTVTVIGEDL